MPKNRKQKLAARFAATQLGVNYTTALRLTAGTPSEPERWTNPHGTDPMSFEFWLAAHKTDPRITPFAVWAAQDVNSGLEIGRSQWAYDGMRAGKNDADWPDWDDPANTMFYASGAYARERWLENCRGAGTRIGWMIAEWWEPQDRYEDYSDQIRRDTSFPLTGDYGVALAYLRGTGATPDLIDAFNGLWTAWMLAVIDGSDEPSFSVVKEVGGQHHAYWRTLAFFDRPLPTFPDSSSFLIRRGHVGSPQPVDRKDMAGFDAGIEWFFSVQQPEAKRWFRRKVWPAVTITQTFGDNYVSHPNYECEGRVLATTVT